MSEAEAVKDAEAIARAIEPKVRTLIAKVNAAKVDASPLMKTLLGDIEYELGGMLPPVSGTLRLPLEVAGRIHGPITFRMPQT